MQDRTSANSMKVLLQRTAGPYMGSSTTDAVNAARSSMSALPPKADKWMDASGCQLCVAPQQKAWLFDHLVGTREQ
jgi:hypothetical protein